MSDLSSKYEDIDVMTSVMDSATTKATAKQVPQEEVDKIKRQIADEAGLELSQELNSAEPVKTTPVKAEANEEQLGEKLKALRLQSA
jgi:charged multivesicular body protein 1